MVSEVMDDGLEGLAADMAKRLHAEAGKKYTINGVGHDYFDAHLEPVVAIVREAGYGPKTIAGAYLHDVVEDCGATLESLIAAGIPEDVARSVIAVSKKLGQSHQEYLQTISRDPRAIVIKVADSRKNLKNTLESRAALDPYKFESRQTEYTDNLKILEPLMPSPQELPD
jgi:(p)ppGpp synthase/HD superfamily hydrolase